MVGLFAQMWLLELAAFLLGAAVTWLVFVRPARAAAVRAAEPVPPPAAGASEPAGGSDQAVPTPRVAESATGATDPALAGLDAHARHASRAGLFAAGVLEELSTTSPLPVVWKR